MAAVKEVGFFGLHRNIQLRIAVGFVQRFLNIMLVPLMVIYFADRYGAAIAGLLTLVIGVLAIVATFLGGHLSDLYGRRPMLLVGEVAAAVTFAGMALANSPWWDSAAVTFGCYVLNTGLASLALPANDAMLVDVSTPETRSTVYGINYWSINVAFAGGSVVGGFLYAGYFPHLLLAATVLSAGIALVTWHAISETAPTDVPVERHQAGAIRNMLSGYLMVFSDGVFVKLLIAAVLTRGIEVQISSYLAVRLAEDVPEQRLAGGLSVNGVELLGLLRTVNTVLVVALAFLAVRALRRVSDRNRLQYGIALFTLGYAVLAVSDVGWVLIAATVVFTIGEIVNVPTKQALLADLVRPDARTKYLAAYQLNVRFGLIIGSLCVTLGAVVAPVGMAALYLAFGAAAIVLYRSLLTDRARRVAVPV